MILRRKLTWVAVASILLTAVASFFAYRVAYSTCAGSDLIATWLCNPGGDQPQFNVQLYETPVADSAQSQTSITNTQNTSLSMPRPWNGKERVNILVMGIDQREGEQDTAYRTDTMIVLTLDPVTMHAGMLSIPRDLWVPIPGYDNGRINTANFLGDAYNYPGGGPALARKTVEQVLGVPINFYARVNFTAFEELVDNIGGITVDVPEDIYDPDYPTEDYGTEVFSISKGTHTMDGATALKFARTRHSLTNGDFDRARNQQLVLLAVKQKVSDPQVFLQLLSNAPQLIQKLSASVKTDLTFDQIQQLAALAQKVDSQNIQTAVLDQNYTESATTLTNPPQEVEVPLRAKIAELRETFFSTPVNEAVENTGSVTNANTTSPTNTASLTQDWHAENATVVVLNGTMNAGYAQKVADILTAQGFNVQRVGNSTDDRFDYDHTEITNYGEKPLTISALTEALNIQSSATIKRVLDPNAEADVVVVIGNDVKLPE
jgi:LCP family protein required for cell wall assembly